MPKLNVVEDNFLAIGKLEDSRRWMSQLVAVYFRLPGRSEWCRVEI